MQVFRILTYVGNSSPDYEDPSNYHTQIECKTIEEAEENAYEMALAEFMSYGGLHGYGETYDEFMENNPDASDEDYDDFMVEEASSWIDYHAITDEEWLALDHE